MTCAAASLTEMPRSRVIREYRYDRDAGLRSSAFTVLVHFLVPSRMTPMMSAAMLRGRSAFFAIIVLCIVGLRDIVTLDHDGRLAAVGVRDPGTSQMQHDNHRLCGVGADFGKNAVEAFAA